jgi:hypothetical protein
MDNAFNNDTMMEWLEVLFRIDKTQHIFCFSHIINLIMKSLLFGRNLSAFEKSLIGASDEGIARLWRDRGVVGKVHNVVKWIMGSDQRRQGFQEVLKKVRRAKTAGQLDDGLYKHTHNMLIKDGGGEFNIFEVYPTRAFYFGTRYNIGSLSDWLACSR